MADSVTTIGQWWSYINQAEEKSKGRLKASEDSKAWYEGTESYMRDQFSDWDGELVRGNLWQRDWDILHDSLWADDPKFSVICDFDGFEDQAEVIEQMALKVWQLTGIFEETDICYQQALHENIGFMKLEYDRQRQLPTLKRVTGYVAVDPNAKGILKYANWVSEIIHRPIVDVLNDTSIPEEKRKEILAKVTMKNNRFDLNDTIKFAYIYSKRGAVPWEKQDTRKYVVICDKLDDFVSVEDWPWPFIAPDKFPIYMLKLKKMYDKHDNPPVFKLLESLFRHFNWTASFNMADTKRACQSKTLVDTSKITEEVEQNKITSGKQREVIKGQKLDNNSIMEVKLGTPSETAYRSAEFAKALHDEQSGITDIIRGEPSGGRQTAEEVRTLKSNAAIVFQGFAKELNRFLNECISDLVLAICYYVPAFSRISDGETVWHKELNRQTGVVADVMTDPNEYGGGGPYSPGKIVRPGVDAYLGPEKAQYWPDYSIEELSRMYTFSIEAGSTRADNMLEEQRNSLAMLQQLAPIYQGAGMIPQLFELIKRFIDSFRPKNASKLYPTMTPMMLQVPSQPSGNVMSMMGARPDKPFGDPNNEGSDKSPASAMAKRSANR